MHFVCSHSCAQLCGVLREPQDLRCQIISITCIDTTADNLDLAQQIRREVIEPTEPAQEVAYRSPGSQRYERRVQAASDNIIGPIKFDKNPETLDTVVVTGDLGGLGLLTAEVCAELGARNIVLVSRSGNPKQYDKQKLDGRLQKLLNLTTCTVAVEKCDVADEAQVVDLLARVRRNHGEINAVVHSAGILPTRRSSPKTSSSFRTVFQPKAHGLFNLHKHTLEDKQLKGLCRIFVHSIIAWQSWPSQLFVRKRIRRWSDPLAKPSRLARKQHPVVRHFRSGHGRSHGRKSQDR